MVDGSRPVAENGAHTPSAREAAAAKVTVASESADSKAYDAVAAAGSCDAAAGSASYMCARCITMASAAAVVTAPRTPERAPEKGV